MEESPKTKRRKKQQTAERSEAEAVCVADDVAQVFVMMYLPRRRYKRFQLLKKGTYSRLVKCSEEARPAKNVIIKKLSLGGAERRSTLRELWHLTKMDAHPNVVHLRDSFYCKDHVYLVFPESEMNLHNFIDGRPVTQTEREKIIVKTSLGLLHMHKSGVVHRDVKPENILVTESLHDVRIADLGSSADVSAKDLSPLSATTTYPYRAPEGLIKGGEYTEKVDAWSLGCVLSELLTGKALFLSSERDESDLPAMHREYFSDLPSEAHRRAMFRVKYPTSSLHETDAMVGLLSVDPTQRLDMKGLLDLYPPTVVGQLPDPSNPTKVESLPICTDKHDEGVTSFIESVVATKGLI